MNADMTFEGTSHTLEISVTYTSRRNAMKTEAGGLNPRWMGVYFCAEGLGP